MKKNLNLKIIYEDESLVVVNKDAGIVTHSSTKKFEYSLIHLLRENNIKLSEGEEPNRPGVVHRLDKETSGLILFAKTNKAQESLKNQFYLRKIHKYYHAIVWGVPIPLAGKLNFPISSHLGKKKISYIERAKDAITLYETKKNTGKEFSLIECKMLTGRTHQIRVHMLAKGCPLVGDKVYSKGRNFPKNLNEGLKKKIISFNRHALHATAITFYHPVDNRLMHFNAKKPDEFLKLEQVLFEK